MWTTLDRICSQAILTITDDYYLPPPANAFTAWYSEGGTFQELSTNLLSTKSPRNISQRAPMGRETGMSL